MNKTFKLYLIIFGVVVALLTLLQLNKKPILDWRKSYGLTEKKPFGLYVFNQEVDQLFSKKLSRLGETPYNFYSKDSLRGSHNILIIERHLDRQSWKKIMSQVGKGSTAMVISDDFPFDLADTLKISTSSMRFDSINYLSFTDKQRPAKLKLDRLPNGLTLDEINPKTTEILGQVVGTKKEAANANFVKVKIGKGEIYFHMEPLFLTNYYLLKKGDEDYAQQVFSYLPKDRNTYWFVESENVQSSSPMRFILANPPLRYAWYIFLLGMIVFIFFHAKRRQRIVPIIKPLENTSVEFVRSIGNLYRNEGNTKDMMRKKVTYFLNKVRTELLIDTSTLDDTFVQKLHLKTNQPIDEIQKAVLLMQKTMNSTAQVSEEDLTKLNETLDKIYK